jgi:four helix bundle protein
MEYKNMEKKNNKDSGEVSEARKEAFKMRIIDFSVSVMKLCKTLRKDPTLWSLCDQIIRSATSIGANINEAQGATTRKDFANYFQVALKSARETRYWIQVIERYDHKIKELKHLREENDSLINILQASIKTLRSKL